VALRVNPDVDAKTHTYISTGKRENKFGIDVETALAADLRLEIADTPWHTQRDNVCEVATTLGLVVSTLGKLARDVAQRFNQRFGETFVVPDVAAFPGHIACDEASRSEIVVPILQGGTLRGVLDVDSPERDRFDDQDRAGLEEFVRVLAPRVDWETL